MSKIYIDFKILKCIFEKHGPDQNFRTVLKVIWMVIFGIRNSTLNMLNPDKSYFKNSVDPDQLALCSNF